MEDYLTDAANIELENERLKQELVEVQTEAAAMRGAIELTVQWARTPEQTLPLMLLDILRATLATNAGAEMLEALRFYAKRGCGTYAYGEGEWQACPIDKEMGTRARKVLGMEKGDDD